MSESDCYYYSRNTAPPLPSDIDVPSVQQCIEILSICADRNRDKILGVSLLREPSEPEKAWSKLEDLAVQRLNATMTILSVVRSEVPV